MFCKDLKKVPNNVNKRILKLKTSYVTRIGNRIHRSVVFTTMCMLLVVILGTVITSRIVAYADSIEGVGVEIYWDQACTNRVLSFDWGLIVPGSNITMSLYVRNEGDSAVFLWMETSNWNPSVASDYMTLIWTYSDRILNAGEVVPIDLILNVSPNVSGINNFSFDITITTTG